MHAAASDPKVAAKTGVPVTVAKEFAQSDPAASCRRRRALTSTPYRGAGNEPSSMDMGGHHAGPDLRRLGAFDLKEAAGPEGAVIR
jgi:hypothetical protein